MVCCLVVVWLFLFPDYEYYVTGDESAFHHGDGAATTFAVIKTTAAAATATATTAVADIAAAATTAAADVAAAATTVAPQ